MISEEIIYIIWIIKFLYVLINNNKNKICSKIWSYCIKMINIFLLNVKVKKNKTKKFQKKIKKQLKKSFNLSFYKFRRILFKCI